MRNFTKVFLPYVELTTDSLSAFLYIALVMLIEPRGSLCGL